MSNAEVRAGAPAKVEANGDLVKISGYAAVFDSVTNIGGQFEEVVERGAFKDAIGRDDVVLRVDHVGLPLARTRSGTLKLTEDDHGLFMETELDMRDPDVRSIVPKMERGDLDKMSFAFYPVKEAWDDSGEIPKRSIQDVQLQDVAIVTFPAYGDTEVALRSLAEHRSQQEATKEDHSKVAKMRMRLALAKA